MEIDTAIATLAILTLVLLAFLLLGALADFVQRYAAERTAQRVAKVQAAIRRGWWNVKD